MTKCSICILKPTLSGDLSYSDVIKHKSYSPPRTFADDVLHQQIPQVYITSTANSLVSGHPRELKKRSVSRHLHLRRIIPIIQSLTGW